MFTPNHIHQNLPNTRRSDLPDHIRRRRINLLIAAVLSGAGISAALPSYAEGFNAAAATTGDSDVVVNSVIMLGTSRKDTTVLTSTSPIQVISERQLRESGATTLNQALSFLDPSFNFPQGQNAVKGMGVRSASLRGVGPGYTLVLVNGKRRNVSAMLAATDPWTTAQVVNINVIPVSAIDHVEILRDGAAAQYGSDAIAGVINIILKSDTSGGSVDLHGGAYTDGGGATKSISASRAFELGKDGFLDASFEFLNNNQVSRTNPDWRQLYPNGDSRNASAAGQFGGIWGQAARDDWKLLLNGELGVGKDARAYGYVNYADQTSSNFVNFDRVVLPITAPIKGSPDQVTDPYNYNTSFNPWLYPNGNQPQVIYGSQDLAAVSGIRFGDQQKDGKLDLSVAYGSNTTRRWVANTDNPSWGAASATSYYLGSWVDSSTSLTADYVKELTLPVLSEPVILTAGLLHRHENWHTGDNGDSQSYTPGPLAGIHLASLYKTYPSLYPYANPAANAQATANSQKNLSTTADLVGIRPQDDYAVGRNVYGAYLGGDFHISRALELGLTGRYEHYSDFGNTSNYKLTGRYELSPALSLRATASTGFHAPSLALLGQQTTSSPSNWSNNGSGGSSGYILAMRSSDPREASFGGKPLNPEKSRTLSLGTVWKIDNDTSLTVDAYRLSIDGVITGSQNLSGVDISNAIAQSGIGTQYSTVSYALNAWDSTSNGLDIVANKHISLNASSLDLSAALNLNKTSVSNVNKYVTIGNNQYLAISDYQVRDAERGTPRNKIVLSARYRTGPWVINGEFIHYGTYWYNAGNVAGVASPNGNVDQKFAPEGYLNAGLSYRVNTNLHVDLSIQNLLNKYPQQYVAGNSASGINPYSFIAPNGAAGRYVYAGLALAF